MQEYDVNDGYNYNTPVKSNHDNEMNYPVIKRVNENEFQSNVVSNRSSICQVKDDNNQGSNLSYMKSKTVLNLVSSKMVSFRDSGEKSNQPSQRIIDQSNEPEPEFNIIEDPNNNLKARLRSRRTLKSSKSMVHLSKDGSPFKFNTPQDSPNKGNYLLVNNYNDKNANNINNNIKVSIRDIREKIKEEEPKGILYKLKHDYLLQLRNQFGIDCILDDAYNQTNLRELQRSHTLGYRSQSHPLNYNTDLSENDLNFASLLIGNIVSKNDDNNDVKSFNRSNTTKMFNKEYDPYEMVTPIGKSFRAI